MKRFKEIVYLVFKLSYTVSHQRPTYVKVGKTGGFVYIKGRTPGVLYLHNVVLETGTWRKGRNLLTHVTRHPYETYGKDVSYDVIGSVFTFINNRLFM